MPRKFCKEAILDIEKIMPTYFRDWDVQQVYAADSSGQWAEVVHSLWKFMHRHHRRYEAERRTLSRADQLTLYTDLEAPSAHELKAYEKTLAAYQWHMLSAQRQQDALRAYISPTDSILPATDTLVTFDWREKIKLPLLPIETGAAWHAQQKIALSCYGAGVFRKNGNKLQA